MTDNKDDVFDDKIHEIDAKINGIFWYSDKISLSNVCITLILEYEQKINEINEEDAKDELYRILKGVSNRAASRYLMRPVIGFISIHQDTSEKVIQLVNKWSADQDWHKGEFIIYPYYKDEKASETYPKPEELLKYDLNQLNVTKYKIETIDSFMEVNQGFFDKALDLDEDDKNITKKKVFTFVEKLMKDNNLEQGSKEELIGDKFSDFRKEINDEASKTAGEK